METIKGRGYVGRTAEGDRLWIEIALEPQTARGPFRTVEHEEAPAEFYRLSIRGSGLYKGSQARRRNDYDFGGQCVDTLRDVVTPASGWTVQQLTELANIWDQWHLNDMSAGCAHRTPWRIPDQYGRMVPSLLLTKACPITGYRYGHAWLIKTLPDDIVERVKGFVAKLDGTRAEGE